jgi:uncharacterized protein (DUF1800 family)
MVPVALLAGMLGSVGSAPQAAPPDTTPAAAIHLLNRIAFGPRPGDVRRVQQLGAAAYIDEQLHPERLRDEAVDARLRGLETLTLTSADIARRYELPALEARRRLQQTHGGSSPQAMPQAQPRPLDPERRRAVVPLVELSAQKIVRAVYSERQLQEVLTDFWFNHFNVDARKGPERFMLTEYERDVIRPHVLGRFRDLLGAVARSPAMLFYLDNWMSADPHGPHRARAVAGSRRFAGAGLRQAAPQRATGLNENYGRELLELHTLGVDAGYTQKDVTEVARAFTGWTIDRPRLGGGFRFAPTLHDEGEKLVLGHRIGRGGGERDGDDVLDILASHPSTARFLSMKLARRFVSDDPPPALVDRMAATFQKSGGDLRAVMTVLLTSPEFLSPDTGQTKMKTPFEFVVSALRATGAEIDDAKPLVGVVQQLGMPLYQCQPPTGYTDTADAWVNTGALVNRINVALRLSSGRFPGVRLPADMAAASLLPGPVSEATHAAIARAATDARAAALALGSPEFQRR